MRRAQEPRSPGAPLESEGSVTLRPAEETSQQKCPGWVLPGHRAPARASHTAPGAFQQPACQPPSSLEVQEVLISSSFSAEKAPSVAPTPEAPTRQGPARLQPSPAFSAPGGLACGPATHRAAVPLHGLPGDEASRLS